MSENSVYLYFIGYIICDRIEAEMHGNKIETQKQWHSQLLSHDAAESPLEPSVFVCTLEKFTCSNSTLPTRWFKKIENLMNYDYFLWSVFWKI